MNNTNNTEQDIEKIDWNKADGLVPAIIQHANTHQVLMLGYMNKEALLTTMSSGLVTFYSRSKKRLWQKGETSGNVLRLCNICIDCDNDALLVFVEPVGPTCHTGRCSCFGDNEHTPLTILTDLETTIQQRLTEPCEGSYTSSLFKQGLPRIAQKVGEEGVEVSLAGALQSETLADEAADLLYHLLVLLTARGNTLKDVLMVLQKRAHNSSK